MVNINCPAQKLIYIPFLYIIEMVNILWQFPPNTTSVILEKSNSETLILSIGDFITYDGRPDGVRIEEFTFRNYEIGPIGMTYLPWRKETQQWARPEWSISRGNRRHLIAYPCGITSYGEHPDWNTVKLLNGGECPIEDLSLQVKSLLIKSTY